MQVKTIRKLENNTFELVLEASEDETNFFVNIALDYLVNTIRIIRDNEAMQHDIIGQIPDEEFIKV